MVFRDTSSQSAFSTADDDGHYGRMRQRVFALAAGSVAVIGLLYTAMQPAVYRSAATVLMSAPTAIDEKMLDADIQGVAIQRRTLTGSEITRNLAEKMRDDFAIDLTPLGVRRLLDVEAVPATNLLELRASGPDPDLLPTLVESWIEVYTDVRATDIEARKSRTLTEVQDELDGLSTKLESARTALEDYRETHEIISMERQENAVLAELDGLNKALNNAVEAEVKTQAYLDTLKASLAQGEQVVPQTERSEVAAMNQKLTELKARLTELRARYTEDYIRKDPRLREIPQQVQELETALSAAFAEGSVAELANAERDNATARETVRTLRQRLEDHKAAVSQFNTIYATHEALVEDLARLEQLNRETQARQVQIQVRQVEKYPQVSIVDWPRETADRIGPPYSFLLGGTLLAALVTGVLGVWLYSYLNPRTAPPAFVTLSGVHMYPQDNAGAIEQFKATQASLGASTTAQLAHQEDVDAPSAQDEDRPQTDTDTDSEEDDKPPT